VLIKNGYGGVSMAFSVYPDGTGSRIEYRKKFGTIGGIWRQCIGPEAQRAETTVGVNLQRSQRDGGQARERVPLDATLENTFCGRW